MENAKLADVVMAGRLAVDAYRTAHTHLYDHGWYKGISEDHTPLLEKMKGELRLQGFDSLKAFWVASESLNDGWR